MKKYVTLMIIGIIITVGLVGIICYAASDNQNNIQIEDSLPETAAEFFSSEMAFIYSKNKPEAFEGVNYGDVFEYEGHYYKCSQLNKSKYAYRLLNKEESEQVLLYEDLSDISFGDSTRLIDMLSSEIDKSDISYYCMSRNSVHGVAANFYRVGDKTVLILQKGEDLDGKSYIRMYDSSDIKSKQLVFPKAGESVNLYEASEDIADLYTDTLVTVIEDLKEAFFFSEIQEFEKVDREKYISYLFEGSWY